MMRSAAAQGYQLIVSTQSVELVNEFDPENLIVVDKRGGASVFNRPDTGMLSGWLDDDNVLQPLRIMRETTAPEDINDGPDSAPSKRILKMMPRYDKTFHGSLIACTIGLDAIRNACPHFDRWLKRLEDLSLST